MKDKQAEDIFNVYRLISEAGTRDSWKKEDRESKLKWKEPKGDDKRLPAPPGYKKNAKVKPRMPYGKQDGIPGGYNSDGSKYETGEDLHDRRRKEAAERKKKSGLEEDDNYQDRAFKAGQEFKGPMFTTDQGDDNYDKVTDLIDQLVSAELDFNSGSEEEAVSSLIDRLRNHPSYIGN